MDPYGNGYVVPDAAGLRLTRSQQASRDAWNRGDTNGAFSTCWIEHGKPPRDDGFGSERYHYVMLVQAAPEELAAYGEKPPYQVLMQNHQAHIVRHEVHATTAYALFETDWIIPHGILRKTDTPVMIMARENDTNVVLSLADPDLRLPKRRNVGYLDAEAERTPANVSLVRMELRGAWALQSAAPGVAILERAVDRTVLEFACAYGATTEVQLTPQLC